MKGLTKKILTVLLTVVMSVSFVSPALAEGVKSEIDLNIQGSAAFLMEVNTGKILYADNAFEALPIASMTKMMSAYIIEEAVRDGRMSWDQQVTISNYAYRISQDMDLSNVPLLEGSQYTVRELYEAAIIYSANGATIALAEALSGTEQNFVDLMNERGAEIGMTNFEFVNTTGLNNSDLQGMHPENTDANAENIASARDVAVLGYRLITDFPEHLETAQLPWLKFREGDRDEINMKNWNWMLPGHLFEYEGIQGLKTGSTIEAGSCFTGLAERGGVRLLSVVMNTADRNARFVETRRLFDFGFNNFEVREVLPLLHQEEGFEGIHSPNGREQEIPVATEQGFTTVVESGRIEEDFEVVVNKTTEELAAPVEKGTVVGTVTVTGTTNEDLGYLFSNQGTVNLVTTEEMAQANFFVRGFRAVGSFFGGIGDWIGELF